MPEDLSGLTPEERSARLLSRLKSRQPSPSIFEDTPSQKSYDADLIPDVQVEKSPEDRRLDGVLESIDIIDAYVKLIGKMHPEVRGNRTEGIKISCPLPNHPDNNPSAWINTDKQTWFCGGCEIGGDIYDLAAIHFGYDLNAYKSKQNFPVLRKQLAEAFGYTILSGITGEHVVKNEPEPEPEPEAEDVVPSVVVEPSVDEVSESTPQNEPQDHSALVAVPDPPQEQLAPVIPLKNSASSVRLSYDNEHNEDRDLYIPWEKIVPYETFLRSWMEQTTIDDLPHEFYFGLGLQALGFAAGRNNILEDFQDVRANLYICLYGRTGLGKSRSIRPYLKLLEEVFPFAGDKTTNPDGVRILPTPGSGEALIDSFRWDVLDPSTNQFARHASVSGLVRHEELSGLVARAARQGSSIKEVLMEMYDVHGGDVTTHSRSSGIAKAHDPFCQMISTTQPNAIHAFLRRVDIESGFLNRWLYMAGVPRVAPIAYGGVYQDIGIPTQILKDTYVWARQGHKFVLAGDALDAWAYFFQKEMAPFKSGQVAQESIFSRVDLVLKKAIIDLTVDERRDQPTGDIVERALMMYPYLKVTYGMFAKDITFNDVTDCQSKIIDIIENTIEAEKTPPSKRDLSRQMARRFDGETIVRALRNLVDLGMVEENSTYSRGPGRPTLRYVLPPA